MGTSLDNRFFIDRMLDKGKCGQVYKCQDKKNPSKALVLKMSSEGELTKNEINAIKNIYGNRNIKKENLYLHHSQTVYIEKNGVDGSKTKEYACFVMPRY